MDAMLHGVPLSELHPVATGRSDAIVIALADVAVAIGVGVLFYVFATGRQRSARWRERTIAEHGQAGYEKRRKAWTMATWGLVVVGLCVTFVPQLWKH